MSIRLRLTLLYTVILALTLVGFSVAIYLTLEQTTLALVRSSLMTEAERISSQKRFSLTHVTASNGPGLPSTYVQTRDAHGAVLAQSFRYADFSLPLDSADLSRVAAGEATVMFVSKGTNRLLVYSTPVKSENRIVGVLQVARSLGEQDEALFALRRLLIIGCGLVPLLAFGIAWLLAGAALRPITRITATAHTIGEQRAFDQRVQYQGPTDEVGTLAATFNIMLQELQGAYAQTQHALNVQRRFVADASHELRTPLTTIRGNIGLLDHQPPISEADKTAVLQDTIDETDRIIRLVNNMFVLARADIGETLRPEPVPIRPLLEAVVRQFRTLAPEHSIEHAPFPDLLVCADADALRQVLLGLLDNARRHAGRASRIKLELAVEATHACIRVRDDGFGIAPELLPRIFDRFVRGDPARSGDNAGLGLAIAKTLTEAQGGTLSVESMPGRGSVFTVALPLAVA